VDIITVLVADDLNFDVPWSFNILFNKHMIITKTLHSFTLSSFKLIEEFAFIQYDTHTLAATTE